MRFQTSQYHVDVSSPPPAGESWLSFNPPTIMSSIYNGYVTPGQQVRLSWTGDIDGVPIESGNITLAVDYGSGFTDLWTKSYLGGGVGDPDEALWIPDATLSNSTRLRITHVESGLIAYSTVFAVISAVPTTELEVTNPVAGTSWRIGNVMPVRWNDVYSGIATVFLHLDDGTNRILATVPNNGVFDWTVNCLPQVAARIRVFNGRGEDYSGPFVVYQGVEPPPEPPSEDDVSDGFLEELDRRLDNGVQWGSLTRVSDGLSRHFYVSDRFVRELSEDNPDRLRVYQLSSEDEWSEVSGWQFDYESSWLHLAEVLPKGTQLRIEYSYQLVSHTLLSGFLYASLGHLFPAFYAREMLVQAVAEREYVVTATSGKPASAVTDVWVGDGETWPYRLTPSRDYRVARGENDRCLLTLFSVPTEAYLRIAIAARPPWFSATRTTLASLGLPEEIRECMILYAIWQVHAQGLAPRMRFDQAIALSASAPTVRDQQTTTQLYKLLLETEVEIRRMRPWTSRGI